MYEEEILQTHEYKDFCQKWGLDGLINPNFSYDDYILEKNEEDLANLKIFKDTKFKRAYYPKASSEESMYYILFHSSEIDAPVKMVYAFDWSKKVIDFDIKIPNYLTLKPATSEKLGKEGKLSIEVNLNYSKKRLMEEINRLIDTGKELYEDEYKRLLLEDFLNEKGFDGIVGFWKSSKGDYDSDFQNSIKGLNEVEGLWKSPKGDYDLDYQNLIKEFEKIYKKKYKQRQKKYKKKYHFDNFNLYLQVYDLRQEGKSWSAITSDLNLNSVQTARNHFNAACEIIEKGVELYVK